MIPALWMLHVGHELPTFAEYLGNIAAHLLGFALIGLATWWYLRNSTVTQRHGHETNHSH